MVWACGAGDAFRALVPAKCWELQDIECGESESL